MPDILEGLQEPINKLTVPVSTSIGETLDDLWDLAFGGFSTYVEKKRIQRLHILNEFKESLEKKVASIPFENHKEPELSVIGPALEASKYYYEEKTLKELFVNLISKTFDCRATEKIHPSFVEIIKQMSSLDAQNLCYFNGNNALPIVEYRRLKPNNEYESLVTDVFLANENESDIFKQSTSISSLLRFGLIFYSYSHYLMDDKIYEPFMQHNVYKLLQKDGKVDIRKGRVWLSPLGADFVNICFDSAKV